MSDTKELKLQLAYDAAGQVLAPAGRAATEAARARNRARQAYKRALHDLVTYRERRDSAKPTQ